MNEAEAFDLMEKSLTLDPRKSCCGIFTGGSFVLDSARVFSWFETVDDLVQHLLEVQPLSYTMDEDDLAQYQSAIQPLLAELKKQGLSEPLKAEVNAAVRSTYVIDWWGSFDEIKSGPSEFARDLRSDFRGDAQGAQAIQEDEMEDFIEFLQTCGC